VAHGPEPGHVMQPIARLAALVSGLAHIVGGTLRGLLWFAPARWPWALGVALLLGLAAWQSIEGARRQEASQPRPEPVGLQAVVDGDATGWVGTSSVVRGPFLDSSAYGAPVLRYYYLLLDPADPGLAMVARSTERLEDRRSRTIVARVEADRSLVADATAALGDPAGVNPVLHFVELPDRPQALLSDAVATPVTLDATAGDVVILRADFGPAVAAADGDGWEYVARTDGRAVIVRSPHPPERLPVDVWGVAATDPVRVEQALAVPEMDAALDGRDAPAGRLLAEGESPPIAEISYVPAMVFGVLALILAIGWAIGYPVFSRTARLPGGVRTWPLEHGDELPAVLYGLDARGVRRVAVEAAPGRLERLPIDEIERRAWQFALHDGTAAPSGGDVGGRGALTLSSSQGPLLVRLEPPPAGMTLAGGTLVDVRSSRPALRLRGHRLDLVAAFTDVAVRDRALAALTPDRLIAVPDLPPPAARTSTPPPMPIDASPLPVRASALVLGAVALLLVAGGGLALPGGLGDVETLAPSLAQVAIGLSLGLIARGVWLRRDWARTVGFTVAWVGAMLSVLIAFAAPQCGLWLSPNLAACQAAGPIGVIGAVGAAIGFAYAALAIARHPRVFTQ
ncbi:MAG: hypothetical protein ACRDGD_08020, partial [Candidatus Limnocylindria bacterium]